MSEKRFVPLLQRYAESGALRRTVSGVEASRKRADGPDDPNGGVTWNVAAHSLAGEAPQAGDYLRDAHGEWYEVTAVEELARGVYPCVCKPWGAEPEATDEATDGSAE